MTEKIIRIVKTQNRIVLPKEFKEGDVIEIKKILFKKAVKE